MHAPSACARVLLHPIHPSIHIQVITEAQSSGDNAGLGAASLGDKRISLDEFCAAVPQIETWGSTNGRPPLVRQSPLPRAPLLTHSRLMQCPPP